jgi:superfamily II RNA helicase
MEYRGLVLDDFQIEAIAALENGESALVAAPTGTGKTVVADWVVERALSEGREVVYTAPIKALSNQKYRDYCSLFGEDNVGLVTGDLVINRSAPCRVMTTEILRNILLSGEPVPNLSAVVIDEIHFLDDRERGTVWEEVLIYLPEAVQIVGLSATLSNLDEFAGWLQEVRNRPVRVVVEEKRAVPLEYLVATRETGLSSVEQMPKLHRQWFNKKGRAAQQSSRSKSDQGGRGGRRGRRRGDRGGSRIGPPTRHHHLFRMLRDAHLPYLYFVFSRQDAEHLARDLGRRTEGTDLLTPNEQRVVHDRLEAFEQSVAPTRVLPAEHRNLLERGIGFHHAGLHVQLKALTERLYEEKLVKVLYCTGTFALGINMPARTAVFDGMMRFDGRKMIPLPTREFMQMAGRAGRRGMDEAGTVVVRADIEDWPKIEPDLRRYLSGRYEPVHSRFSLSFNSVVNLLDRHPTERIRELVQRSFLAYHRRQKAEHQQQNAERLSASLGNQKQDSDGDTPRHVRKKMRRLERLNARADGQTDRTWQDFQQKVNFLTHWGYLAETGEFNAGARVLCQIQIQEIFTTELFLSGAFEDLEPDRLFGVLAGMCTELAKRVNVNTNKRDRRLGWKVTAVRDSEIVREAERLTRSETCWDPRLIGLGTAWAEGKGLGEIRAMVDSTSDVSGDLVGAFRRAKELAGQIRAVYGEDEDKTQMLTALIRSVARDEVEVVG